MHLQALAEHARPRRRPACAACRPRAAARKRSGIITSLTGRPSTSARRAAEHRLGRRVEFDDAAAARRSRPARRSAWSTIADFSASLACSCASLSASSLLAQLQLGVVAAEHRHHLDLAVAAPVGNEGLAHVAAAALGILDPAFEPQRLAARTRARRAAGSRRRPPRRPPRDRCRPITSLGAAGRESRASRGWRRRSGARDR